jgi:hypothetical protein
MRMHRCQRRARHSSPPPAAPHTAVYGRENRLRVVRDEEKAAAAEAEVQGRHELSEREHRHRLLLEKARERYGYAAALLEAGVDGAAAAAPALVERLADDAAMQGLEAALGEPAPRPRRERERRRPGGAAPSEPRRRAPSLAELARQLDPGVPVPPQSGPSGAPEAHAPRDEQQRRRAVVDLGGAAALACAPPAGAGAAPAAAWVRPQHINLFAEEQARASNPEQSAEARLERTRRGDPLTQTSDAKFDKQFAFGHGVAGAGAAVPWYARREPPPQAGEPSRAAGGGSVAAAPPLPPPPTLLAGVHLILPQGGGGSSEDEERRRKRRRRHGDNGGEKGKAHGGGGGKKEKRRSKSKDGGRDGGRDGQSDKSAAAAAFAALREERVAREAGERRREAEVVRAAAGRQGDAPGGRRYHTGFGFGR